MGIRTPHPGTAAAASLGAQRRRWCSADVKRLRAPPLMPSAACAVSPHLFSPSFWLRVAPQCVPAEGRSPATADALFSEERPSAAGFHVPRRMLGHRSVAATRPRRQAGEGAMDAEASVAGVGDAGTIRGAVDAADAAAE